MSCAFINLFILSNNRNCLFKIIKMSLVNYCHFLLFITIIMNIIIFKNIVINNHINNYI